jgi:hypothetical protein
MSDPFSVMMNALDRTEAALQAPVIDLAAEARRRRIADKIKFHHMVEVGDCVFVSHRRAAGVIEELIIRAKDEREPNSTSYGKFIVRLDDGQRVVEHPEHLTKSVRS